MLTETQTQMVADMDDVAEHVAWEFDADEYEGLSACGFAHITNIDGRSSFVKRIKSLADSRSPIVLHNERRDEYDISVGGLELSLRNGHNGYQLSVTNVQDFRPGPEFQRMDVRERLHSLVLGRLQYNGYLEGAWVKSRMD